MELPKQGYEIETIWVNEVDTPGIAHRVAKYLLTQDNKA
jgi:hypothetical protein